MSGKLGVKLAIVVAQVHFIGDARIRGYTWCNTPRGWSWE